MTTARLLLVAAALTGVAGAAGYYVGRFHMGSEMHMPTKVEPKAAAMQASEPVVYYRHPDGAPVYSATPKRTEDGRAFIAVRGSEDTRFDAAEVSAAKKQVLYYRNPMGLPDVSKVPKKDPMGMDYIPVYEGEDDASTIKISPGRLQRTGVRSQLVERQTLTIPVRAPGRVDVDERLVSVVAVRSQSFVDKVENVTTGDTVQQGQTLLQLYSPEVSAAAAQYLSAVRERGPAPQQAVEGAKQRLQNLGVADSVITDIERNRKAPLTIPWASPRHGLVLERNVSDGMRAMPGDVLFRIADHATVWVLADVPEREMASLAEGQPATVKVRGFLEQSFAGSVALIYPHLNRETRTVRVRIELPNPSGILRPEMYADVEINTGSREPVLVVPSSAVLDSGTRQLVLLDKGDGRFESRDVKLGQRAPGLVEVREGLTEGDHVVTSATFLIDAESNLKAALRGLTSVEGGQ